VSEPIDSRPSRVDRCLVDEDVELRGGGGRLLGDGGLRHLYDLRHTYGTFAWRAGVSVFAISRFMGSSIAMIDRHYGHLARDSREHAVSLLEALAIEERWTLRGRRNRTAPLSQSDFRLHRKGSRGALDAQWTAGPNGRRVREEKELKSRNFVKPSNGLEPLTPSLPWRISSSAVRRRRRAARLVLPAFTRLGLRFHLCLEAP
jgi:hypothetical protein